VGNDSLWGLITHTGSFIAITGEGTYGLGAGKPDLNFPVTLTAGATEGLLTGSISISHNDPTKDTPYLIPVDLFVFTDFACPKYVVLHTKWLQMEVSNIERVGVGPNREGKLRGMYRPTYALSGTPPGPDSGNNSVYDGSLIIARPPMDLDPPGGDLDTVVYRFVFGTGNYAKGFRPLSELDVDTSAYGTGGGKAWAFAHQTTVDSILGVDVKYEFPQDNDSSDFVLVKYKIFNRTASTYTGLAFGEAVDFDVMPATMNPGRQSGSQNKAGTMSSMNLLYQQGIDSAAVSLNLAEKYLGGMTAIMDSVAGRAWIAPNDPWLFGRPGGGFSEGYLYDQLTKNGFEIIPPVPAPTKGGTDQHSVIVFGRNVTLGPTDVQHYVLGFVSSKAGPATTDLVTTTKKAWKYAFGWEEILDVFISTPPPSGALGTSAVTSYPYYAIGSHEDGPTSGCVGCVITEISDPGNKFTLVPDANPCTGHIDYTGSPSGTYTATYSLTTIPCAGVLYTENQVMTVVVNTAPVLATIGAKSVTVNTPITFNTPASDINGTIPTLTAQNLPPWATFTPGSGTGNFSWTPTSTGGPYNVTFIASDGSLTDSEVVAITVTTGTTGSCFQTAINYGAGNSPMSVCAADMDGDEDADLAVANGGSNDVSVLKNNGGGTFAAPANYAAGNNPWSVFAAGLDGDNDADLVVANRAGGNVSVLKNNGNGTFAAAVNYAVGSEPVSVFAADLDGDNDADLAVANFSGGSISVLKNNGDGTFAAAVNHGGYNDPVSVFAADLDADGDADLAVANNGDFVSVLKNTGVGTFAAANNYALEGMPASVFAADLDGDGDADLAVARYSDNIVSVLKNNGDGTFAAAANYAAGDHPVSLVVAYLDGDVHADLATANKYSDNVSVLRNNGDGTFAAAVNYAVGSVPYSVFAADLDGDRSADLAVANANSANVSILFSCSEPSCSCPHQGDFDGSGSIAVQDVLKVIQIAFVNGVDTKDPSCPKTRGDADSNDVVDVNDVLYIIRTAFMNGPNPVNPCGP